VGGQCRYGIFLGGLEKTAVLKTFAPHIFFDDSIKHIDAARSFVPTALVPYHSASLLHADSYLAADKDASLLSFTPAQQTLFTVKY
jgi:5'-nucleotidase